MLAAAATSLLPAAEIAIVEADDAAAAQPLREVVARRFLPSAVVVPIQPARVAALAAEAPWVAPLQALYGAPAALLCRDFVCERPTSDAVALAALLDGLTAPSAEAGACLVSALVQTLREADGAWLRLQLDAPPGHILSLAMVRELTAALADAQADPRLQWVTVEGSGGEFCYGASIQEHLPGPIREVLPEMHRLMRTLLDLPHPTAAIVEGRCLGGGFELALCCDDIMAADSAIFGLPEIRLAAFPPVAAALLPIRVGASRATRAVITGDTQSADYWHNAGLVSLVAASSTPIDAARDWFERQLAPHSAGGAGARGAGRPGRLAAGGRTRHRRQRTTLSQRAAGVARRRGRRPRVDGEAAAARGATSSERRPGMALAGERGSRVS